MSKPSASGSVGVPERGGSGTASPKGGGGSTCSHRNKIRELGLVFFLGFLFTTLLTWPFITKLSTFCHDFSDFSIDSWIMWYNWFAIATGRIFHINAYFNSNQFFPWPFSLAYSEHLFVPSLLFSPIYGITKNLVFSVNLFNFATFILTFLAGYFMISYFVKDRYAGILGAFIFTFNPITFSHFAGDYSFVYNKLLIHRLIVGQIHYLDKYFLPLIFLFGFQFLKKPGFKNTALFFLFFTLNALSVIYFQIFSILLLPIFSLPFLILHLYKKDGGYFVRLLRYASVFVIFVPLLLYFDLPYLHFSRMETASRSLQENVDGSARLIDYFCSNPDSFLYGAIARNLEKIRNPKQFGIFNYHQHTLSINILPFVLAVIGIFVLFKKERKDVDSKLILAGFGLILIASFVFSLGPLFLGWNNNTGELKLPFYYLFKAIPNLLSGTRVPTRFEYFFYIPFSLFGAYGAQKLLRGRARFCMFLLILSLLIAENSLTRSYDMRSHAPTRLISNLEFLKGKNTLHVPVSHSVPLYIFDSQYVYWGTLTGENMLNGVSGFFPEDWTALMTQLRQNLGISTLRKLAGLGINYIIFHKDFFNEISHDNLLAGFYGNDYQKNYLDKNYRLYEEGKIYEDKSLLVVDLAKYNFIINECSLQNNFQVAMKPDKHFSFSSPFHYQLLLKNMKNCYLFSRYENRYLKVNVTAGGKSYLSYLVLPMIISPFQQTKIDGLVQLHSNWLHGRKKEPMEIDFSVKRLNMNTRDFVYLN